MTGTVLILGSHGRFGRHTTAAFAAAGWIVRKFDRTHDTLSATIDGVDVVVNAWNPAGYHLWDEALVARHADVAKAARNVGATVLLPGNVYVFGPGAPMPWGADTPHLATNRLGVFRERIEAGYRESGAQTIVLRCGDYIDGQDSGNWFETHIAKTVNKGFIRYPGDPDAAHAWAWLPDAARAAVALTERRHLLGVFEDVPFEGYTLTGNQLAEAIGRALVRPMNVRPFRWGPLHLYRPFVPILQGVFEMRYLWSLPHRLDGARLRELVPDFVPAPAQEALRAALRYQVGPTA